MKRVAQSRHTSTQEASAHLNWEARVGELAGGSRPLVAVPERQIACKAFRRPAPVVLDPWAMALAPGKSGSLHAVTAGQPGNTASRG